MTYALQVWFSSVSKLAEGAEGVFTKHLVNEENKAVLMKRTLLESVSIIKLIRCLQGESFVGNVYFVKVLMEYPGPHTCTAISWIDKLQSYNTIFCATFVQPRSIDTSRRLNAYQCAFAILNVYDEKTSSSPTLRILHDVLLPSDLTRIQAWQLVCFTT